MKKKIYILLFLFPVITFAQKTLYKSSPLDYMWMNVGNPGFSSGSANFTSLAFNPSNGQPYIAFEDHAYSSYATVMNYDGNSWDYVGLPGFSNGIVSYTSIVFNPVESLPYVVYESVSHALQISVEKFNLNFNVWESVGARWFSPGEADYPSLAFSPLGMPYVAFGDHAHSTKATVMRFDGSSWVNVGNMDFSTGEADFTSLAFNPTGEPYVAFKDLAHANKATVMKYDGINWVFVGSPGFSSGPVNYTSLAFSMSGEPYVAFQDMTLWPYKATVMKFDGSNWLNVGNADFSSGSAYNTSIIFNPSDGQPYIAFAGGGACVMRFDWNNWVNVGSSNFSGNVVNSIGLAFSSSGQPYVAFTVDTAFMSSYFTPRVMKYDSVYVGINELKEPWPFLYPNPASKTLTIVLKQFHDIVQIEIDDMKGVRMFTTQTGEKEIVIDVANFPCGIYFVKIQLENSFYTRKFCKN